MSDLFQVTDKLKQGKEWRGSIRVTIDDEEHELTIRQLVDPEFEEVMDLVDKDELQELQDELPEDELEEYRELREKEELDEEESERFAELEEDLSEVDMFEVFSQSTFKGIRLCAKYGVEPDDEDLAKAFSERASEIESEYGIKVQVPDDVYDPVMDEYEELIEASTNFVAFQIGLQVLTETLEEQGNS